MGVLDKFLEMMMSMMKMTSLMMTNMMMNTKKSQKRVSSAEKRLMMKATKTITSFLPSLSSVRPVLIIK